MDGWRQILGMLQIAGSQDPPAKINLDTHEVTAVVFCKYKLQFAWVFPVYTLLLIFFPMASIYAHISYFFFISTCFWLLFMLFLILLAGSNLSLSEGYRAKQISAPSQESKFTQGPALQTPRQCLSLKLGT